MRPWTVLYVLCERNNNNLKNNQQPLNLEFQKYRRSWNALKMEFIDFIAEIGCVVMEHNVIEKNMRNIDCSVSHCLFQCHRDRESDCFVEYTLWRRQWIFVDDQRGYGLITKWDHRMSCARDIEWADIYRFWLVHCRTFEFRSWNPLPMNVISRWKQCDYKQQHCQHSHNRHDRH